VKKLLKVFFKQITRERVLETCKEKSPSRTTKGKLKDLQESETFRLALIAKEPTMLRKIVGTKINLFFIVFSAIIFFTVKSIVEPRKNNLNSKHNNIQI
jgi:hypothetical protein